MYRVIFISLYLFASSIYASSIMDLEKRNVADVTKPNGAKFEMGVVRDFWGNPHFMRQCLPPGSPEHKPFTIYIEILKTGKIGQLVFTVNTKTTKCIETFVREKHFQKPSSSFVAKINMNFKKLKLNLHKEKKNVSCILKINTEI